MNIFSKIYKQIIKSINPVDPINPVNMIKLPCMPYTKLFVNNVNESDVRNIIINIYSLDGEHNNSMGYFEIQLFHMENDFFDKFAAEFTDCITQKHRNMFLIQQNSEILAIKSYCCVFYIEFWKKILFINFGKSDFATQYTITKFINFASNNFYFDVHKLISKYNYLTTYTINLNKFDKHIENAKNQMHEHSSSDEYGCIKPVFDYINNFLEMQYINSHYKKLISNNISFSELSSDELYSDNILNFHNSILNSCENSCVNFHENYINQTTHLDIKTNMIRLQDHLSELTKNIKFTHILAKLYNKYCLKIKKYNISTMWILYKKNINGNDNYYLANLCFNKTCLKFSINPKFICKVNETQPSEKTTKNFDDIVATNEQEIWMVFKIHLEKIYQIDFNNIIPNAEWIGSDPNIEITDEIIKNATNVIINKNISEYEIDKNKYIDQITKVSNFLTPKIESINRINTINPELFVKIYNFNKLILSIKFFIDNHSNHNDMSMKINQYVYQITTTYKPNSLNNNQVFKFKEFDCIHKNISSEKLENFKKEFKEFVELNKSFII